MAQFPFHPLTIGSNTTTPPPPPPPPSASIGSVEELTAYHAVPRAEALYNACLEHDLELIEELAREGVDLNSFVPHPDNAHSEERNGDIPILAYACMTGAADLVELLLERGAKAKSWMLAEAIERGHGAVIDVLCKIIDINMIDDRDGLSFLQRASFDANPIIVARLIAHRADVNLSSRAGTPPLILAFSDPAGDIDDQLEVMAMLLDAGADIERSNREGHTPLSAACQLNYIEVVSLLLRRGANPNAGLPHQLTPFAICCLRRTGLPIFTNVLEHGGKLPTGVALRLIGWGSDEPSRAKREQLMTAYVTEGHWPTGLRQFRS
jgi:ankyrin repeat protein